jgi:hypothetical protein
MAANTTTVRQKGIGTGVRAFQRRQPLFSRGIPRSQGRQTLGGSSGTVREVSQSLARLATHGLTVSRASADLSRDKRTVSK